jgi:deoxyribose-phosphate aldolase
MKYTYEEIAGMIDHSLLHPTMTDAELKAGCELAAKYEVASVCIKPYAVKQALEWLRGSKVKIGAVIAFPTATQPPRSNASKLPWRAAMARSKSTW